MPMCFHSGNNSFKTHQVYATESGFGKSKLPIVSAFHTLLNTNLPAKFPKLRWGFIEVSSQWVPYVLKLMSKSIMADNNFFVACQVTDDLPYVLEYAGEGQLVVGTDYGHADTSTEIEALRKIKADGKISASVADKILDGNARALYGL